MRDKVLTTGVVQLRDKVVRLAGGSELGAWGGPARDCWEALPTTEVLQL